MDRQIVDPDPGINYNAVILTGGPNFKMEKIDIVAIHIVDVLWIVMLHDTVLSRKTLVHFW